MTMSGIIPGMLITYALKAELKDFFSQICVLERVRFTKKRYLYKARYKGIEFHLLQTGIGPGAVSLGLDNLPGTLTFTRVLNIGTCGLLNDEWDPGMLLMPEEVISTWDSKVFYPEAPRFETGRVRRCVSVGKSENSEEFREYLIRKYNAQIVDMEAWSVLAWADERKLPVSIVKAVSDRTGKNAAFDVRENIFLCSKNIAEFLLNE